MIGRRLTIRGHVQGVFFRNWTVAQAQALGLRGWVRNRRDGSVEVLAFGPDEAVAALTERCREGPPAARVDHVAVEEAHGTPPEAFSQAPTV